MVFVRIILLLCDFLQLSGQVHVNMFLYGLFVMLFVSMCAFMKVCFYVFYISSLTVFHINFLCCVCPYPLVDIDVCSVLNESFEPVQIKEMPAQFLFNVVIP